MNGARCVTCGEKDASGIKTSIIKKYMALQAHYREMKERFKGQIPASEQYYCKGRNAVLQELMKELGLRKDVKKPLSARKRPVN